MDKSREFLERTFEIVYPDETIFAFALDLRRSKRMKLPDALIRATARSLGTRVVTRDTKDFDADAPDIYVPYSV
jgi:predicted nucleic acid-binding protein